MILVLWDIDRTLLYCGDTDRRVYTELFEEVVGQTPERLPARGTGVTMPLAVRELLNANGVELERVERLAEAITERMPGRLAQHRDEVLRTGQVLPGAAAALRAVHEGHDMVPTVVTGNLRGSAEVKLRLFQLDAYLDLTIGAYASDNHMRPALVRTAQDRATIRHNHPFNAHSTVIIGDSLEDVRTGREGGARVLAVASGTTSAADLRNAGADRVVPELTDTAHILRLIREIVSEPQSTTGPHPIRRQV
ncbi:HAD hydrolase-like protein [Streptomyces sp. SID8366]|uniref:HAD family hydrolase n=1 Tax=unclassified Streptomyces TaxID=2593676 RepID=UPI000DB97F30|nr:haloacid dehalogenase-like hydrolase [Streptomyces sp. PsTaAH-130]MYU06013.1 HAD hydrolase-like protein [Streptomyces sp. SID8366]MYU67444.1 HAD hydrolase-like protein [Streptomyces sp. SID69]RAJ64075.1 phosphoglycolate phosphatase-like HAD superfamily hydrolase [Streptomyces sp. PsTaAH-130]